MSIIVAGILTLVQYVDMQKADHPSLRPICCIYCGEKTVHRHATYERVADRENNNENSLNPITIQRYFCPGCNKTCSVLPECIAVRRWYPWSMQQAVLLACLLGIPLNKIAQAHIPSRSTCKRWWVWLHTKYNDFSSVLRTFFPELGRHDGFTGFWLAYFDNKRLSYAMYYCHQNGVIVP